MDSMTQSLRQSMVLSTYKPACKWVRKESRRWSSRRLAMAWKVADNPEIPEIVSVGGVPAKDSWPSRHRPQKSS
eukprot:CAMPEP_0169332142 /NCGR_PEP_ID=MMETSP1017-20121227/14560_1 /TAXON_ID=342587 /ORGANISM="Karlodinium micrum, Strain CCMP2283" /LENGTH=73 /DNA_ID=CAMNT_0009427261 /DNA_START=1661 /DNA_END=1878 /DNA_ORIENTATION=+